MRIPTIPSSLRLAALAGLSLVTPAFGAVNIDYVTIGNAGNTADPATGYGSVAYNYKISKYETTINQYAEFLNAAAKTDTTGLWHSYMGSDLNIAGITRTGASGTYTYSVTGSGDRPISYVSWFDAARFVNWMHNGQGSSSAETGVYSLNGATNGIFTAQSGATIWLPTENEWYKAAYYDPTPGAGGGDNYWLYSTQTDILTNNTVSANYNDGDYVGSGTSSFPTGNALTNVGSYGESSESYYGTLDQGGNVWEWNDATITGGSRGMRGGSWGSGENDLRSSLRNGAFDPSNESTVTGFRLATVPEPTSVVIAILTGGLMLTRRKR